MRCCVQPRNGARRSDDGAGVKTVGAGWRNAILVCRKCSKKVGGGFGPKGRTPLAKALRDEAGLGKGRKAAAGVVEVGCLKICPKQAVMLVDAARPGKWLVVARGTPIEEVVAQLDFSEK
jgi:predicted metal-binding protein